MSTKTMERKLNNLNLEVTMLRSAFINVIGNQDPEGQYRPEFVSRILKLAKTRQSGSKFTTSADLLKRIGAA